MSTIRAEDKIVAVATKVAIQMNCKLGGEPWMIQQKAANTMIIGIDTYHDTGLFSFDNHKNLYITIFTN